jgi:glycine cleavage system protein P-like pyridoxal-binding family
MVESTPDAAPQILIKIQNSVSALRSEMGALRSEVGQFRTSVEGRLDRLEQLNRKYRRDAAAMMVIMRATAGDFDERVNEVVERVDALEARTS